MANAMNEMVFKQLSQEDRDWVLLSMVMNIEKKQPCIEKRIKKLETHKIIDRSLSVGAGAIGGSVTMFFIWMKQQVLGK